MRYLLVAIATAACAVAPIPEAQEATILEVIDGDSLLLRASGEEIELRLRGINAPEQDECMGPEAANALAGFTEEGVITFDVYGTDQFGRALGDVYIEGAAASEAMVEAGMALALSEEAGGDLYSLQQAAYAAGLGMWSADACGAATPRPAIRLVELIANPPGPDEDALETETVTVDNSGDVVVSLAGWVLRDESSANRFVFPRDVSLTPGGSVVVSSGCGRDPDVLYWCSPGPVWNNGGDTALLLDDVGRVISVLRHGP